MDHYTSPHEFMRWLLASGLVLRRNAGERSFEGLSFLLLDRKLRPHKLLEAEPNLAQALRPCASCSGIFLAVRDAGEAGSRALWRAARSGTIAVRSFGSRARLMDLRRG